VHAVGHAQLAGQPDQPIGAHDGRIEAVEVDAGRNGLQPVLERRKALQRIARHVLRHGDHRVGPRLAALDEAFGKAIGDERRMQRGDPLDLEPAGERACHPPRGGRTRLDQRDAGLAQAGGKLARQREPRPQRMAALRQLEMGGAQPQQVGHHAAARRGDDGRAAGRDHSLRRVERGARQAAAGEGRDDLQERRGRHVSLAVGLLLWQVIWHER
jgi:hypothetical protein